MVVNGIAGEFRQVVANLVANAVAAAPVNGKVRLEGRQTQNEAELAVVDNGPGVAAHLVPRLFEPFFTTKQDVGTGLGLWVSRQIARKHGGDLRYERTAAGETRFILELRA